MKKPGQGGRGDELTPDLCKDLVVSTGKVPLDNGFSIKYWKYSSSTKPQTSLPMHPIVTIHGGPAVTHSYLLPLKQQACRGRTVYFYDQAGCGESEIPDNKTTADFPFLLDPQYYVTDELPAMIEYWGLQHYHLIGNSWGTILAQYFELNTQPDGLTSMVLSGPLSDGVLYAQSQWDSETGNLATLPPFVQQRLHDLEELEQFDSDEFYAISLALTGFFSVRTVPAPDCWMKSLIGMNSDIYVGMQGPSEFSFAGVLQYFNTTPRLPSITVPTLLTSGTYDTMRPPVVRALYESIPKVEWVVLNHSGHVSMIDDPGWMNDVIEDFLNRVEAAETSENFVPNSMACGPVGCTSKYFMSNSVVLAEEKKRQYSLWVVIASFLAGLAISSITSAAFSFKRRNRRGYESV